MHRTGWSKLIARTAALALYLVGTGLAPLADARLEARASRQTVHVEGQTDQACPQGHDHASCGLCVNLRSGAAPAGSVPTIPVALASPATPAPAATQVPTLLSRTTRHSRAPPLS